MTSFIQRQISMMNAVGDIDDISEGMVFPFRLRDVRSSTILRIPPGLRTMQSLSLDAADTYTVQLPDDYTDAEILHGIFVTNGVMKAVVTSPELTGTSTQLINGTEDDGRGSWVWQQRVTSIVLSNPTAATIQVEYMLFLLPDLDVASSYRDGPRTIGYVEE